MWTGHSMKLWATEYNPVKTKYATPKFQEAVQFQVQMHNVKQLPLIKAALVSQEKVRCQNQLQHKASFCMHIR